MQTVTYSRGRLAGLMVLSLLMMFAGWWCNKNLYGRDAFAGAALIGVGALAVCSMLRFLLDNRVLAFDWRHLTYFSILGERTITWEDLEMMEIEETYGSRHLKLTGPFATLIAPRVSERLLGAGLTIELLVDEMERAQSAPPPPLGRSAPMATYPNPEPAPRIGGFGRKGL